MSVFGNASGAELVRARGSDPEVFPERGLPPEEYPCTAGLYAAQPDYVLQYQ
jgi:hypothetical protein